MRKMLNEVLSAIKPGSEERRKDTEFANSLVSRIRQNVPDGCRVVLTGSMAKKTFLRQKCDIDIFVLFPRTVAHGQLEDHIKHIMRAAFPSLGYQLSYAEHPYARFHYEGRQIDLVPAYHIQRASQRMSAVDRSVFHTRYINKTLAPKQLDDVLLLKAFLKANSLYGAEIKVSGFSGYLCELLIASFSSFTGLARAVSKWKMPVFIDSGKHYPKSGIPAQIRRFGFFTVIDPVDKNRNVAAAVSRANLRRFISLCGRFLQNPSKQMFLKRPESFERRIRMRSNQLPVFMVMMPHPDVVADVLWGQLHKMVGQLERHLHEFEPRILADDDLNLVRLAIILKTDRLDDKMLVQGPPLGMKKHVTEFRKNHPRASFVKKKGRIFARVKRPVADAETAIRNFFREYSNTDSHLAFPEEMLIVSRFEKFASKKPRRR